MAEIGITNAVVELRRIAGDIDDEKAAIILSLNPTRDEIEAAVAWAEGRGDARGDGHWPLDGKAGQIFEILTADDEEERPH